MARLELAVCASGPPVLSYRFVEASTIAGFKKNALRGSTLNLHQAGYLLSTSKSPSSLFHDASSACAPFFHSCNVPGHPPSLSLFRRSSTRPRFQVFAAGGPPATVAPSSSTSTLATVGSGTIEFATGLLSQAFALQPSPVSLPAATLATALVFVLGSPVLLSGLTVAGMAAAFVLGLLTWHAFGLAGFLIVAAYFVLGTAVTKVRIKQKEEEGIAEKRSGRRGPSSVLGSGAAGVLCALAAAAELAPFGWPEPYALWTLGFVASFCTKLSDTGSSEVGKAFGKTTYLITTLQRVPRGTEGAVSLEGTAAGLVAAVVLASLALFLQQVSPQGALLCVAASQLANLGESWLGATLQDKPGWEWLSNDVVNVLNITLGASLAIIGALAFPP